MPPVSQVPFPPSQPFAVVGLRVASSVLQGAAAALQAMAQRLARPASFPATMPHVEFHAEAGAPEGALYVDGEYVGRLPGVTRL